MMGDSGKPFACGLPGCTMTFSNQDHLEVHQKKHDMKLIIAGGMKSLDTPVIADQTPTPTRFLKNCEEVGLFNDLENPFDSEFSHAIDKPLPHRENSLVATTEASKVTKPVKSTTTPILIAPSVSKASAKPAFKNAPLVVMSPTIPIAPAPILSTTAVITQLGSQPGLNIAGPILLRLPNGTTVPVAIPPPPSVADGGANVPNAIPVGGGDSLSNTTSDPNGVKQRLKAAITSQNPQIIDSSLAGLSQSPTTSESRKRRHNSDEGDDKRQKFLERNRAAASRCRNKRKYYIHNLEKRADDFQSTNSSLQNEVTLLRNEIAQLKQLLLAHKDCPITELQRKTQAHILRGMQESTESSQVVRNSSTTPAEAATALAQLAQATTTSTS